MPTMPCTIFSLRESSDVAPVVDTNPADADLLITQERVERLRPEIPDLLTAGRSSSRSPRKKVLVLGVYLAAKPNNVDDIVSVVLQSKKYRVTQRWVALGGQPSTTRHVARVTAETVLRPAPKFEIMNELLAKEDLSQYEFVLLLDDDIVMPNSFVDQFLSMQEQLEFSIAQPARTSESYIDHPIVEQQRGVLARQTLFVEIGPVVSFHKRIYDLVFPFDLTSSMGWGYENVWAHRLEQAQKKMGIIDVIPVSHSLRKPVAFYRWDEADRQRALFLSKHEHLPLDQCFRVLDVFT
jgi:hypothetical protein